MSLPTSANLSLSQINSCLRITNGNIGIGTTAPAYKLDIVGNINASALSQAGSPFVGGGSTFNATVVYSTTATLTTTSPTDVEVSGQIGPVTIALPANNTSGNIITVHNLGGTTGSTSSDVFVRTGTSTTSGSLARISPGESVTTMALQTAGTRPTDYQKTISRKGGQGLEWTERSIPNNRNWWSVCWAPELGIFCAVNNNSAAFVMTSPDGITWTERSIPNTRTWYSICWAPELRLFCAVNVGSAAFVMTSPDGITWTERSIPNNRNWTSVTWAPELRLFCAVNDSSAGFVMTSPDGITWTERSIPNSRSWLGVTWAPELGLFCAVKYGDAGAWIMTSPNGTTWTERSIPTSRNWRSVTWSPELGIFCAVNTGSAAFVMTSPDGITWTERSTPNTRNWMSVTWASELGLFVAVNDNSAAVVMTSANGITWTERSIPNTRGWAGVCWSPELLSCCAVNSGSTAAVLTSFGVPLNIQRAPTSTTMGTVTISTNTVNYTIGNFFTDTSGTGMYDYTLTANPQSSGSLSNGILSVTGNSRNTSYTITVTGRNGINRTASSSLIVTETTGLPIATSMGTTTSLTNNTVQYTLSNYFTNPPGYGSITYSLVSNPQSSASISAGILSVTGNYRNINYTVTVRGTNSAGSADSSLTVIESPRPLSGGFTARSFNFMTLKAVCWSPGLNMFVALNGQATSANIARSSDGISWTTSSIPNARTWCSLAWSPSLGLFCATNDGHGAFVMTSPDGINWTERAIPNSRNWVSITWAPALGMFVAVNKNNAPFIMASSNGTSWTEYPIPTTRPWTSITWSPELGRFAAVCENQSAVLTSTNGTTWLEVGINSGEYGNFKSIAWSPQLNLFCAIASQSHVLTSSNGTTWTKTAAGGSLTSDGSAWASITWAAGINRFVAVTSWDSTGSGYGNKFAVSSNGTTWSTSDSYLAPESALWTSITWSQELMRLCAVNEGGSTNRVATGIE